MCNSFVIAFARSRDPSGPLSRAFPIFRPPPSPPFAPADAKVSEPAALHVTYRWLHGPSRVICATVRTIVCELRNRACLAELIPRSRDILAGSPIPRCSRAAIPSRENARQVLSLCDALSIRQSFCRSVSTLFAYIPMVFFDHASTVYTFKWELEQIRQI